MRREVPDPRYTLLSGMRPTCKVPPLRRGRGDVLDAARAQLALPAQGQNPPFFLLKDFLRGTVLGPPTLGDESFHSLLLIAPYPLAQGRSGDATAAAVQPCIVGLLLETDPC